LLLQIFYSRDILQQRLQRREICVAAADIVQQRYTTAQTTAQRNLRCSCRFFTAEIYYSRDYSAEKSAFLLQQTYYSRCT
jgi:hypothetical protein